MIALTSDGKPFIEHKPDHVSIWINSSTLKTMPVNEADNYSRPRELSRRLGHAHEIDPQILKMALSAAAEEFKVAYWMVKAPSKNTDVQRARGKAAHLLMALRGDDGRCSYELEQIAIALDFYDLDTMIDASHEFLPDDWDKA